MATVRRRWRVAKWVSLIICIGTGGVWALSCTYTLRLNHPQRPYTIHNFNAPQQLHIPATQVVYEGYQICLERGCLIYSAPEYFELNRRTCYFGRGYRLSLFPAPTLSYDPTLSIVVPLWLVFTATAAASAFLFWRETRRPLGILP